jgi:dihydroorotase
MGMPLDEVILRSTWTPAHEIRHEELGHLSVGAVADIAVLRVAEGRFGFVDTYGARMQGTRKLECELTIRNGRVVWDLNGITRQDWQGLGKYLAQGDASWDATLAGEVRKRK